MQQIIEDTLKDVTLGKPFIFCNMIVQPLFFSGHIEMEYSKLGQAFKEEWLKILEISERSSVPELKLLDLSVFNLLLLDGEELQYAKHNRVLNTTILVHGKSEVTIPVSCTEQGRWGNVSVEFADTENIMISKTRVSEMDRVHESLKYEGGHCSGQDKVSEDISELQMKHNSCSATSEMRNVYEDRKADLDEYLDAFPHIEGQCGMIMGLGDSIAGFEYLSCQEGFSEVYPQLVESYAMDALVQNNSGSNLELPLENAHKFLNQILTSNTESFPSTSAGTDICLESEHLVGSALVVEEELGSLFCLSQAYVEATK